MTPMRFALAALGLVLSSCTLDATGLQEVGVDATSAATGPGGPSSTASAGAGGAPLAAASSGDASSGAGAAGGGATSVTSAGGGGDGGASNGGGAAGGGGEGGAPPPLGEEPCAGLALTFAGDDIELELEGTPWTKRGEGRVDSDVGRMTVEGDDDAVEIHTEDTEGTPLEGCSVTATLVEVVDVADRATARVSAFAEWPEVAARRRGFEIEVGNDAPCTIYFGIEGDRTDAPARACDDSAPITVRLRHTGAGAELCYDVLVANAVFEEVVCVAAPMALDVGVGASSGDAYELEYGPIP